jgi:ankyrin repeat protein
MLPVIIASKTGNWSEINTSEISLDLVNHLSYEGGNLLHNAAREGQLKNFPKCLLNKEGLLTKDEMGNTVLHIAAKFDELDVIPKSLMTLENLEHPNKEGNTVFHYATTRGSLWELPQDLLTDRTLSLTNNKGKSSLDSAMDAFYPNRKTLRTEIMKKTIKLILKNLGDSRLQYVLNQYQKDIDQYQEIQSSIGSKTGKIETETLLQEKLLKKKLITKEILERSLVKHKNEHTLEV